MAESWVIFQGGNFFNAYILFLTKIIIKQLLVWCYILLELTLGTPVQPCIMHFLWYF